jgi:hypothetical protein
MLVEELRGRILALMVENRRLMRELCGSRFRGNGYE